MRGLTRARPNWGKYSADAPGELRKPPRSANQSRPPDRLAELRSADRLAFLRDVFALAGRRLPGQ
jgi:hypothetical protein